MFMEHIYSRQLKASWQTAKISETGKPHGYLRKEC